MDTNSMSKEDRRELILEFLDSHDLALPPAPLYYNLREKRFVTFSKRTLQRLLKELENEGLVRKVPEGDGYWEITDQGRRYLTEK